jgi:hypothetical protein
VTRLDAAEYERARTFLIEIANDLLPEGTQWGPEGNERRAEHTGGLGLSINTKRAAWLFRASGKGGCSPLGLIEQLRPHYSAAERLQWLKAWLAQHRGTGSCTTEADDDGAHSPASVARAQEVLVTMRPAEGTPAETYLRSRGIEPPYDGVGYIEDARRGVGALQPRLGFSAQHLNENLNRVLVVTCFPGLTCVLPSNAITASSGRSSEMPSPNICLAHRLIGKYPAVIPTRGAEQPTFSILDEVIASHRGIAAWSLVVPFTARLLSPDLNSALEKVE